MEGEDASGSALDRVERGGAEKEEEIDQEEDGKGSLSTVVLSREAKDPREDNNSVHTTRHKAYSFFFVSLVMQFRRVGNVYFLAVSLLMLLGLYSNLFSSSITPWGQLFMLAFILLLNISSEGVDELGRYRSDKATNNQECTVLEKSATGSWSFQKQTWGHLKRGQVVLLKNLEVIPADMLLVATSHALLDPCAYTETSQIDGETYLKRRFTLPRLLESVIDDRLVVLKEYGETIKDEITFSPGTVAAALEGCKMSYSAPTSHIGSFKGRIDIQGEAVEFSAENLLLRGAILRNTGRALGIVVYTGKDTTALMANKGQPRKVSTVDHLVNKVIVALLLLLALLIAISELFFFYGPWVKSQDLWYLRLSSKDSDEVFPPWLAMLCQYVILYKNILPILLYGIQEGLAQLQARFINWDLNIYCEETDQRTVCNSTNLVQEIGQVQWVFSDKTGTLTRNEMRLVAVMAGGRTFGSHDLQELAEIEATTTSKKGFTRKVLAELIDFMRDSEERVEENEPFNTEMQRQSMEQLLLSMVLCHTVLIERQREVNDKEEEEEEEDSPVDENMSMRTPIASEDTLLVDPNLRDFPESDADSTVMVRHGHRPLTRQESLSRLEADAYKTVEEPQGKLRYNAESPDEEAIVTAARAIGVYSFVATEGENTICIKTADGTILKFLVLAVNAFSSERKRMSVIVREPREGKILLLCKGADNKVLKVCQTPTSELEKVILDDMQNRLEQFALNGLRTLVFASKELSEEEFAEWHTKYAKVMKKVGDKEEKRSELHTLACEIEANLSLVGSTCVEDRLQENVGETISLIRQALIKFWLITGDKVETAVNIARATKLVDEDSTIVKLTVGHIDVSSLPAFIQVLEQLVEQVGVPELSSGNPLLTCIDNFTQALCFAGRRVMQFSNHFPLAENGESGEQQRFCLVADGDILRFVLRHLEIEESSRDSSSEEHKAMHLFLRLALSATVLIACRTSPAQKAALVHLVQTRIRPAPVTLAIGDGGNDVPMIHSASVGVGIFGKEGSQASSTADFAIAKFKFLGPLLFVHGRLGYLRVAKSIGLIFYVSILFTWGIFVYAGVSMFSGTAIFTDIMYTMWNYFLAVPVFLLGFFDRDFNPVYNQMAFPRSYDVGRTNQLLRLDFVWAQMFRAVVHGSVAFVLIFFGSAYTSFQALSGNFFICLVFLMTLRELVIVSSYTIWYLLFGILLNIAIAVFLVTTVNLRALDIALLFNYRGGQVWNTLWATILLALMADVLLTLIFLGRGKAKDLLYK